MADQAIEIAAALDGDAAARSAIPSSIGGPAPSDLVLGGESRPLHLADSQAISQQVADSIVSQATLTTAARERSFQVRLDPPELGEIQIRLIDSDRGVRVEIEVAEQPTLRAMEIQLPALRHSLEQAGVRISEMNLGQHFGGASAQTDSGRSGGEQRPSSRRTSTENLRSSAPSSQPRALADGAIDVLV